MIEPKYPGAFEQLIDLSSCWNEHKLFESRGAIMALSAKISRCHDHCCRFLGAASSLISDTYRIALDATNASKVEKAAQRIAQAEFKGGSSHTGKEYVRFLSCVTNKGPILFDDTAKTLCDRIYLIEDVYGAASRLLLSSLRAQALASGWNIITCYCPLSPFEKIEHLFIPALRLGFMTSNDYHKPDVEPYKVVRSRRFTDPELIKKSRKRISFNKKASAQMLESAAKLLAEAKALHDQLEVHYIASMNFEKVNAVSEQTLARYQHIYSQYHV